MIHDFDDPPPHVVRTNGHSACALMGWNLILSNQMILSHSCLVELSTDFLSLVPLMCLLVLRY